MRKKGAGGEGGYDLFGRPSSPAIEGEEVGFKKGCG